MVVLFSLISKHLSSAPSMDHILLEMKLEETKRKRKKEKRKIEQVEKSIWTENRGLSNIMDDVKVEQGYKLKRSGENRRRE